MEAFWKFFWIALRGALYTATVAALSYITNFHPQQWDVPLFVGIAMFVESMVAAGGKWVAVNGAKSSSPSVAALAPVIGTEIEQAAPVLGDAVLSAGRRNDPAVPSVLPPPPNIVNASATLDAEMTDTATATVEAAADPVVSPPAAS